MDKVFQYIELKDKKIQVKINNYKNSKSIKIYFKGNILYISKSKYVSMKKVLEFIKQNEDDLYNKYKMILASEVNTIKQWKNGENFWINGIEYKIIRKTHNENRISVEFDHQNRVIEINVPEKLDDINIKNYVDILIKKQLKKYTENKINERLPIWCEKMNLDYSTVTIRDTLSKYGSCMPTKKRLYFSSRLAMLPDDKIDAIIVHELCHMKYKYHDKDFYNMVSIYIPNYKDIDKWLKENGKNILF